MCKISCIKKILFITHSIKDRINPLRIKNLNSKGFTLLEIMVVLAILGILVVIVVPSVIGTKEKAEQEVCRANRVQLERWYESYLVSEGIEHTDEMFVQYLQDYGKNICPAKGEIRYVNGKVECSIHSSDGDGSNENEEEVVPFL
ncbi:prepilin-type N-terminal cleavage/methylation domain-containing protein [Aquibacillus sp. 3ASR75-11]|uniref:Prepilin-type N-terminal cleavage/methylation domain-containing protein n=1 Tax=Terrihalobacillus insolitus TaxID=2950438 RepID=A0A9X4AMH2_9BACI|nr:prepilin-type N-terminal cleavage/methylation domain-containing protein [Terrihalobacillus insolitus]MDC3423490.1 prepilin-type N-terminal cleavage/methylation domain-containing protein [Terrihalobacillus insolitus]